MFLKWFHLAILTVYFLFLEGAACFFVKHLDRGMCINDTSKTQSSGTSWGSLSFVELSNNCLDPAAQFRFLDNGAMFNLKRKGCLAAYNKSNSYGGKIDMFYVYASVNLNVSACAQNHDKMIYRAITQTSWGGLSVYYKARRKKATFQTWCAVPQTYAPLAKDKGIGPCVGLTSCDHANGKLFNFGSVTCHGNIVKNANCPKNQYMVVNTASYRGLPATKTCGLSNDYSCQVDVTCLVKKQCDGQHECNMTVNDSLFSVKLCEGLTRYLYFEYRCIDNPKPADICVNDVFLSHSSLRNEGFLEIVTDCCGNKNVCSQTLNSEATTVVCRQLGYEKGNLLENPTPSNASDVKFSGSINCTGEDKYLSQCSIVISNESCSELSYIKCSICEHPLLQDNGKIPDSSFTSSAPSKLGVSASDARISSNSSWCAPVSNDNHYLQVDLGRRYVLYTFAIYGDSSSSKWVTSFNVSYTVDLINWKPFNKTFRGNKNAYNDVAFRNFTGMITRAIRLIPITFVNQACMRVQICGSTLLPDKPTNLTVTNITTRSAKLSWQYPENEGDKPIERFQIKWKNDNVLIVNTTEYKINYLRPFIKYEISVAAGNENGFGEEAETSFQTSEEAPDGPPRNIAVTAESSSSFDVRWTPPVEGKRNGLIVNYTVCISREENKPCIKKYNTPEQMLVISNLNDSTKYCVRVLASTKAGHGNYSKCQDEVTNGKAPEKGTNKTGSTLTFSLQIPSLNFTHFYVVALKLTDAKEPKSPQSYKNDELVTYFEAGKLTIPKPYIAAVFTSSSFDGTWFVLGEESDDNVTINPTSRKRRSTTSGYHAFNGPLDPGTRYRIFQRIFIDTDEHYSTDWSPASETNPVKTTTRTETNDDSGTDDSGINVAIIAGAVVGFCVLILVVLIIIMFRRRASKHGSEPAYEMDEQDEKPNVSSVINEAFPAPAEVEQEVNGADDGNVVHEDENNKVFSSDENLYVNEQDLFTRIHNPIPKEEFSDHVNFLRQDNKKEFTLEFEDLPSNRLFDWSISKRSFNAPKNRYGNAVTYNHSRVILSGDMRTDYINASFIDGLSEKYYIATQGPKPTSVDDFWRMIFEHKCPTIVMLTTLKEMGKVKCEKYWPDEFGTYGDIKVIAKKTRTFADYVTRSFVVEKGDERHVVQQFHFMSWPDYGVPLYPTQILTFRRHFKAYHVTKTGSAVIHCSAGVGRTGVFIALDKVLDDLDKEKKNTIDIFNFIKDMRTRRVNMVQTQDQYVFIYDAVIDHIKCGANEVEATQVVSEIKHLSRKNEIGETGFEEKFKRLNTVSPQLVKEQCEAALLEKNRKKNRKPEIYPSESSRAYLTHVENVENSDYINACYVDGYLGKNYFIATQTPLKETVNDFWKMVFQHNSSTMVMLNQLREEGEEYPMFWPTKRAEPQSYGPTTVMLDSFTKKEAVVIRKFIVSPSPDLKEGRVVQMIHYMSWPDHGVTANVDDIGEILSEVEDSQRAAEKKGPVIVLCSDGAGRSGTYIAISNLVDRVKAVQVIDVFQCIKLIRIKRPQFVETASQFKLCYNAVATVLKSFNEYANFSLEN